MAKYDRVQIIGLYLGNYYSLPAISVDQDEVQNGLDAALEHTTLLIDALERAIKHERSALTNRKWWADQIRHNALLSHLNYEKGVATDQVNRLKKTK